MGTTENETKRVQIYAIRMKEREREKRERGSEKKWAAVEKRQ